MYIHLGGEMVLPVMEIVAILDARGVAASEVNQDLVAKATAAKRLRGPGLTPECRSLVMTKDLFVYTSGISVATLARRMTHLRQSAAAWGAET